MNKRSQEKKELDLAERIEKLQQKRVEIEREIEELKKEGELAPDGAWIVRYRAKGTGGAYWYYSDLAPN